MKPTTEPALRIAALFRRRPSTEWSEKEVKQFRVLYKQGAFRNLDDLTLVEKYYDAERKKKEGYHRRDLYTFLNNFFGELDRATAFAESQHRNNHVKIDRQRARARPISDGEWSRIGSLARAELERFKHEQTTR